MKMSDLVENKFYKLKYGCFGREAGSKVLFRQISESGIYARCDMLDDLSSVLLLPEELLGLYEQLDPVLDIVRRLKSITEEQRLEVFRHYCKGCGCENPSCQCWNDE